MPKRAKLIGGNSVTDLGSDVRLGSTLSSDVFKVPELPPPKQVVVKQAPVKASDKGKEREKVAANEPEPEDVFGDTQQNAVPAAPMVPQAPPKPQVVAKDTEFDDLFGDEFDGGAMEKANKTVSSTLYISCFSHPTHTNSRNLRKRQ